MNVHSSGLGVDRQVDLIATGPMSAMGSNAVPSLPGYEPPRHILHYMGIYHQ